MRTAFTVRLPNGEYRALKVRAAEMGKSAQECVEDAIALWLRAGKPSPDHPDACPMARASKDHALLGEWILKELERGGRLADFVAGGCKFVAKQSGRS